MPFDFDAAVTAPFRMEAGLRRIAPGTTQLTPNIAPERGTAVHLREKLAVFQAYPWQALRARDGFDACPALDALASHAAAEQPQAFVVDGTMWHAPILGWAVQRDGRLIELDPPRTPWPEAGDCLHALPDAWRPAVLLSLAFAEDFAILDLTDETLPWLAVALPSHWAPEHTVGRPFAELQAPLAERPITGTAPHLSGLVTGGHRWERFGWTITRHPRLHAHPDRVDPSPWPAHLQGDALAAQAWWRTEHQTFIPLEHQSQAVCTIHVQVKRLDVALQDRERKRRVHDALASMSDAALQYQGLSATRERLLHWLSGHGG
ncbi:MAG: DUF3445 domain-containing protein [Burkholderiaceae bacterium]|nr:DUF3445 domain-containing protein [Burkholderiaceae bacterium]